jgi:hypothetical protein
VPAPATHRASFVGCGLEQSLSTKIFSALLKGSNKRIGVNARRLIRSRARVSRTLVAELHSPAHVPSFSCYDAARRISALSLASDSHIRDVKMSAIKISEGEGG